MGDSVPSVTVVIPARYGSSRFPGKPLALLNGKPMIQQVYERALSCRMVSDVLVATDDDRIRQAVERFGGKVLLTSGDYRTGTDRVAAVAEKCAGDFFINLQGDEIPLDPALLSDLIGPFLHTGAEVGTLKRAMDSTDELSNPAIVKVVTDTQGYALYFSRAPIPLVRDDADRRVVPGLHYVHLGLYMYTKDALRRFAALSTGAQEDAEKLEQLRGLEHGMRIRVWETKLASLRVDTPEDAVVVTETLRQREGSSSAFPLGRAVPSR
jgi:3-deoxy-manno-octulosonate cytidylyltransferase (CMP-KDO synthetase)